MFQLAFTHYVAKYYYYIQVEVKRYETIKLNMSNLDKIVNEHHRTMAFCKYDVTLTISFKFLLRVVNPYVF